MKLLTTLDNGEGKFLDILELFQLISGSVLALTIYI